jgi:hypothetical protein
VRVLLIRELAMAVSADDGQIFVVFPPCDVVKLQTERV